MLYLAKVKKQTTEIKFDKDNKPVGIEILNANKEVKKENIEQLLQAV